LGVLCQVLCCVVVLCGCAGTTSSSNTVVVGQDNFPDTDETKLARESEERSVGSHVRTPPVFLIQSQGAL